MYLIVERPPQSKQAWAPVQLAATRQADAVREAETRHNAWKPGAATVLYHMNANGDIRRIASWGWGV